MEKPALVEFCGEDKPAASPKRSAVHLASALKTKIYIYERLVLARLQDQTDTEPSGIYSGLWW